MAPPTPASRPTIMARPAGRDSDPAALAPRERALAILAHVGLPLTPERLADLAALRPRPGLAPAQLAALLAREQRRWQRDPTAEPAWLVPALDADDGSPLPRYLARSDWPLEQRLIGGYTPAVLTLRLLLRLLAGYRAGGAAPDLARLVGRLARTVPDAVGADGTLDPNRARAAAETELAVLVHLEAAERQAAVARLAIFPPAEQLWGRVTP